MKQRIVNRDRSEYRASSRAAQDRNIKHRGGSHGDGRKEASKRAARDRSLWD